MLSSLVGDTGISSDDVRSIDGSDDSESMSRLVDSTEVVRDAARSSEALKALDGAVLTDSFACLDLEGDSDACCLPNSVEVTREAVSSSEAMGVAVVDAIMAASATRAAGCETIAASLACLGLGVVVDLLGCADLAGFTVSAAGACVGAISTVSTCPLETGATVDGWP